MNQLSHDMMNTLVEDEVDLLCGHRALASAPKLQCLLRYLVGRKLREPRCQISANDIFTEVYGLTFPVNTREQPRARVAVSRLRRILDTIYHERRNVAAQISIPIGSYVPRIRCHELVEGDPLDAPRFPVGVYVCPADTKGASGLGMCRAVSKRLSSILDGLEEFESVHGLGNADYCIYLEASVDDFGHHISVTLYCRNNGEILWLDSIDCTGALQDPKAVAAVICSRTFDPLTGCLLPHLSRWAGSSPSGNGLGPLLTYYTLIRTHNRSLIPQLVHSLHQMGSHDLSQARVLALKADTARIGYSHGFDGSLSLSRRTILESSEKAHQLMPTDPICVMSNALSQIVLGDTDLGLSLFSDAVASDSCLPSLETDAAVVRAVAGDWAYGLPVLFSKAARGEKLPYYALLPALLYLVHTDKIDTALALISQTGQSGSFWPSAVRSAVMQCAGDKEAAHVEAQSLLHMHRDFPSTGRQAIECFLKDRDVTNTFVAALEKTGIVLGA